MAIRRNKIAVLSASIAASVTMLVGCGGATVTSDDVTSSSPTAEESSEAQTSESSAPDSSPAPAPAPAPEQDAPEDQPAEQVESIPSAQPERSANEESYLTGLGDAGIDVAGVEDQLAGAGDLICSGDGSADVTVPAVAGQLIEQGRTQLSHEQVVDEITTLAEAEYCS